MGKKTLSSVEEPIRKAWLNTAVPRIFRNGLQCFKSTAYSAINKAIIGKNCPEIYKLNCSWPKLDDKNRRCTMMGSAEGLQASNNVSMHYEIYNIAPYERFKAPESLILAFNIWKSPTGHLVLTPHTHASIWLCAVCCRRTVRVIIPAPHSFGWSEILMGPCSGPKGYLCSQQRQRRKSEGFLWMRPIKK